MKCKRSCDVTERTEKAAGVCRSPHHPGDDANPQSTRANDGSATPLGSRRDLHVQGHR